jgi:hypothetical protein
MNSRLPAWLAASGSRPFAWGVCDCCTWVCDWVVAAQGVDPAAAWRGACASARDAARILRGRGLLALAREGCAAAGLAETRDPLPGDVGVVLTEDGPAMAIRTRTGWAIKAGQGFGVRAAPMLAAWRVECRS